MAFAAPAVRNHRNAVRLALESVSALRRIPQRMRWPRCSATMPAGGFAYVAVREHS
jgi:hypothetical protein